MLKEIGGSLPSLKFNAVQVRRDLATNMLRLKHAQNSSTKSVHIVYWAPCWESLLNQNHLVCGFCQIQF